MTLPKTDRNKELVQKRKKNPKLWTFRKLGAFFNIDFKTAQEIWERETEKEPKKLST